MFIYDYFTVDMKAYLMTNRMKAMVVVFLMFIVPSTGFAQIVSPAKTLDTAQIELYLELVKCIRAVRLSQMMTL